MLSICVACLGLVPATVRAEGKIQVVKKGKKIPFDGILYSNSAHAILVAKQKTAEHRGKLILELELSKQKVGLQSKLKLSLIELDVEKRKHELTKQLAKDQKSLLLGELAKVKKVPWYKSQTFSFWGGIVLAASITALSIWGASELKK